MQDFHIFGTDRFSGPNIAIGRVSYNISMLFLFPVIDGKLSTGVNATFNASCYG